jgi:hypothetical protein
VRIASKGANGDYQGFSALNDLAQDNAHVYAYVQVDNSLEFCDIDVRLGGKIGKGRERKEK